MRGDENGPLDEHAPKRSGRPSRPPEGKRGFTQRAPERARGHAHGDRSGYGPDAASPTPQCLVPSEVEAYRQSGILPDDRMLHVDSCADCAAMLCAASPETGCVDQDRGANEDRPATVSLWPSGQSEN